MNYKESRSFGARKRKNKTRQVIVTGISGVVFTGNRYTLNCSKAYIASAGLAQMVHSRNVGKNIH
jgi:hypothetical protein